MVSVLLFIPNLIGYLRILIAIASLYYMPSDYFKALVLYFVSVLLDEIDGIAARYFNQTSNFGAILDMLTDRCLTICLLMTLSVFYKPYLMLFQFLVCLDIVSHWVHVQSSLMKGCGSHKVHTGNAIMRFYYQRHVLTILCIGTEAFFGLLYLIYFTKGPVANFIKRHNTFVCHFVLILQPLTPVPELHVSLTTVTIAETSLGLWVILAWLTAPICITKQFIHVVQLGSAFNAIVLVDEQERAKSKKH